MNMITGENKMCESHAGTHEASSWGRNGACRETGNGSTTYCSTSPGQWIRVVRDFVKLLKFGEVHLTVHKGRVIEVRKIEKVRFDET
jgi:hypothetical protein